MDVFYTSLLNISGAGDLSAAEQTALVDWVSAGGVLFSAGETPGFQGHCNTVLNPFGLSLTAQSAFGSYTVTNSTHPITDGPNGSVSTISYATGGAFHPGSYAVLATDDNDAVVARVLSYGLGHVVAISDLTPSRIPIATRTGLPSS